MANGAQHLPHVSRYKKTAATKRLPISPKGGQAARQVGCSQGTQLPPQLREAPLVTPAPAGLTPAGASSLRGATIPQSQPTRLRRG